MKNTFRIWRKTFRSDVSADSSRRVQVRGGFAKISVPDVLISKDTSESISKSLAYDFEVLVSKIAGGLKRKLPRELQDEGLQ